MKKVFYGALIVIAGASCSSSSKVTTMNSSNNTLNEKEKNDGWQMLFDGSSTNGWHTYGKQAAGKAWKATDGTLFFDAASKKNTPSEGGDIVTNDEYDNFHLKLDWKISQKGNSGIIFYVHEDPAKYKNTYETGPEMQVLDNDGHPDAKIYKHRAGDLYDLIASKEAVKPAGQWNAAEIVSQNGNLTFYLNGEKVLQTTMWDDNWTTMVANSKFKAWPGFGTFKKGKIALQDHGDDVWYRNIKIKRLN
jgi:hypothetical protein